MTTHNIRIALDGVVRLLSQNLYGEPDAFVREMVQNAHDSIVKRRAVDGRGGRVDILPDKGARTVTIADDGVGLSQDEIHEHLSTIGRSGTDELRQKLRAGDPEHAASLIGQFGIGLLSAFLVAERVTITTRRAGEARAWRWRFDGGTAYDLEVAEARDIGTTVVLFLKASMTEFLDVERLERLVRRYADFLPIDIRVGPTGTPSNAGTAPWEESNASDEQVRRFLVRRFPNEHTLTHVVVDGEAGGQPVRGVLAVTDREIGIGEGRLDLYVRRMYVSGHQPGLRPPWAAFVQGVIACDALVPTASRDRVLRDDALDQVSRVVGDSILDHLRSLAKRDHQTLAGILRWHAHGLFALCLEHRDLLRDLADLMPVKSTVGTKTIDELVRANPDGRRLRYFRHRPSAERVLPLAEARGLVVLDLVESHAEHFVLEYARQWPGRLAPIRIDEAGAGGLIESVTAAEALRLRPVTVASEALVTGARVEIASFEPETIPALWLETQKGRGRRELADAVEELGTPAFLGGALANLGTATSDCATLYLNASSSLLAALARRNRLTEEPDRTVLKVIVDRARASEKNELAELVDLCRALEWALEARR
ncbi:MAG: ATP-binding protein [Myxococcales bacterium]|nr:ATP-binding protein [Myxococcales bacterium]